MGSIEFTRAYESPVIVGDVDELTRRFQDDVRTGQGKPVEGQPPREPRPGVTLPPGEAQPPRGEKGGLAEGMEVRKPPEIAPEDQLRIPPKHSDGAQWTYLINLSADLEGNGDYYGALKKFDEMRTRLTGLTADGKGQIIAMIHNKSNNTVEVYKIAKGKVERVGIAESQGTAKDLEKLVSLAPDDGKVALINQGHGKGPEGVKADGDKDTVPTTDVAKAIKTGLSVSGREKLDMLSFDSCLMGNASVLRDVAPAAATIVASEALEFGGKRGDGQEVTGTLEAMLKSPPANGKRVARELVRQSADKCESTKITPATPESGRSPFPDGHTPEKERLQLNPFHFPENCGTETLAVYDSERIGEFNQALSSFGDALSKSIENPANRKAIDEVIKGLPSLPGPHPPDLKDLHLFADGVLKAIQEGKIEDDEKHTLQDAAIAVMASQARMIPAGYSSKPEFRGVSVFLRTSEAKDPAERFDKLKTEVDDVTKQLDELYSGYQSGTEPDPVKLRTSLSALEKKLYLPSVMLGSLPGMVLGQIELASESVPGVADLQKALATIGNKPVITGDDVKRVLDLARASKTKMTNEREDWLARARKAERESLERTMKPHLHGEPLESAKGWEGFVVKMNSPSP